MRWIAGLTRQGRNRRPFGRSVALSAVVGALALFMIPAGAAGTKPSPPSFTVGGSATWLGGPHSGATLGVGACSVGEAAPLCPSLRTATVAADGSYSLDLPYGRPSTWNLFAIVTVGELFPPDSWALSAPTEVTVPRSPHDPVQLTISTRTVGVRVVDGEGNAFPERTAGIMATPPSTGWMSGGWTDAAGNVLLFLDPTTEYDVTAMATNTGWPNPWVSPDGTEFHFSETLRVLAADLAEGTTFVVAQPINGPLAAG